MKIMYQQALTEWPGGEPNAQARETKETEAATPAPDSSGLTLASNRERPGTAKALPTAGERS
jgi:hypothetical protein